MKSGIDPRGHWTFCYRERPDGPVVWTAYVGNRTTNQGLAYMANVAFGQGGQNYAGPFYAGLIDGSTDPVLNFAVDTFASGGHPGWTEFTAYSGGSRPLWTPGAAASQGAPQLANAAVMTVTLAASGQIAGGFLVNVASLATTSSPTAILWSEGFFQDGVKTVSPGGQLLFTYALNMYSAY